MHIPDGFLGIKTSVVTSFLSAGALSYGLTRSKEVMGERQVPAMGVMAAFIFAAQMVNFTVAPGASGHLLGAALATILLGRWNAGIIITTVLAIQALFFQDGGITALGANVFNLAILSPLVAHYVYQGFRAILRGKFDKVAIFLAAWASIMVAAAAVSVELALSGTIGFNVVFPPMMFWHALIGIGEGLITVVVVSTVTASAIGVFKDRQHA
ncbi:MAG: energy-coupling factor ABC transporter permease [Clostridia bacterium]|nr:energy-coupling factor ABC transporter permease [Clostridia bacterium]